MPSDPYARAVARYHADQANRIIPAFYRYLQAQSPEDQAKGREEYVEGLMTLVRLFEKAERDEGGVGGGAQSSLGLWREGGDLGWADAMIAPCVSFCLSGLT